MDYLDKMIRETATKLKEQIVGGYIHGKVITGLDLDKMLVAAYELGQLKFMERYTEMIVDERDDEV